VPRFFADITDNGQAIITGQDVRHITGPLRKRHGDTLLIRDDTQGYTARISTIKPGEVILDILSLDELHDRGINLIHLGVSIIDLKEMDVLLRYVTELGVSHIHPIIAARSNIRKIPPKRIQRWHDIIREALKQCQRKSVPVLHETTTLVDFVRYDFNDVGLVRLVTCFDAADMVNDYHGRDVCVLVGPEGGFTSEEMGVISANDFHQVNMGRSILRTVTAAITAVAVLGM